GIAKVRVMGAELRTFSVWAAKFQEQRRVRFEAASAAYAVSVFNNVYPLLASIGIFAAAFALRNQAAAGQRFTTGTFLAFNAAFMALLAAVLALSNTVIDVLKIVPTWRRAAPILTAVREFDADKTHPGELTGHIELSHAE